MFVYPILLESVLLINYKKMFKIGHTKYRLDKKYINSMQGGMNACETFKLWASISVALVFECV